MTANSKRSERKRNLKLHEICGLIEACGKNRVSELKLGDLHIVFGRPAETSAWETQIPTTPSEKAISELNAKNIETRSLEQAELDTKEDRLDQMLIEDPAEYEQAVFRGDLTEDRKPVSQS